MDTVRMWMSSPAITAPQTLTLPAARELLQREHIRRLPVVDDDGRLVGILTEGDIHRISASPVTDMREYNLYHRVRDLPIGEVMTRPVLTTGPDAPILTVAQVMLEQRIGGVPVVEDERVVGMITESDLFRLIVRRQLDEAWGEVRS